MSLADKRDKDVSSISAMMQATNLYVYCGNNPLVLVDPSGEVFMLATGIIGAVAGAAIGGAVGLTGGLAASYVATGGTTALATWGAFTGGVTAAAQPYMQQVSDAVYAAADKIADFTVKAKHLMSHQQGFSKFATDSQQQVQAWVRQALQSSNAMFMPDPNNAGRFQAFVDMGQAIGTKGQQIIKIVLTEAGKIITAYPERSIR
ncbi:MAG: hypothetical protein FD169_2505 [Bacillota bacterium]|nr:MAG: hypothetical protein FD169_2505 [Bacillota bacterium]